MEIALVSVTSKQIIAGANGIADELTADEIEEVVITQAPDGWMRADRDGVIAMGHMPQGLKV
jgi:hypothetical protein